MARICKRLDDYADALSGVAQPIIVAMTTAGLTGGAMVAAGMLAGRIARRS